MHGYEDRAVIAGQGTIGLRILEQVPDPGAVVVSVGGGLIAGIALAVKPLKPEVRILRVKAVHTYNNARDCRAQA